ncbi:MAG TPA: malate dehydrogenase [Candidatus Bathyarchaeia archaeon]|nr:malate dehydrogenase [Candidatus Bathyarchaeia archaeon]
MLHIALIGIGRVGQATAFALAHEQYINELTLVDVAPRLAWAVAEEMRHASAGMHASLDVNAFEKVEDISNADIIIVTAGKPAAPRAGRRGLVEANAKTIKNLAETVAARNPSARYLIVTNPVDAMATLFKEASEANYVIGSGCHLDSLRLRAEVAKQVKVPIRYVEGYVGGEHGHNDVYLWSTVKINGEPFDEHLKRRKLKIRKNRIIALVHDNTEDILAVLGGTTFGPATAFREIVRAMALNTHSLISVAAPYKTVDIPEPVYISVPSKLGMSIGPTIEQALTLAERKGLKGAAKAVHDLYRVAREVAA